MIRAYRKYWVTNLSVELASVYIYFTTKKQKAYESFKVIYRLRHVLQCIGGYCMKC